ncbi:MAG: hypothetical protein KJI69_04585 [Patescibacteria group bacterium]|nr:hypothetical protein [Patescibacteria group bacterium]
MKLAFKVVNQIGIDRLCAETKDGDDLFTIEPYLNCREKGFAITQNVLPNGKFVHPFEECKTVVFSQHRRTDELVVFVGTRKWFDDGKQFLPCGDKHFVPSNETWERQDPTNRFSPTKLQDAVKFIENELGLPQVLEVLEVKQN